MTLVVGGKQTHPLSVFTNSNLLTAFSTIFFWMINPMDKCFFFSLPNCFFHSLKTPDFSRIYFGKVLFYLVGLFLPFLDDFWFVGVVLAYLCFFDASSDEDGWSCW